MEARWKLIDKEGIIMLEEDKSNSASSHRRDQIRIEDIVAIGIGQSYMLHINGEHGCVSHPYS